MIQFECPNCHKTFQVPREVAGRKGRCKACGVVFVVPHPGESAVLPEQPAPRQGAVPVRRRTVAANPHESAPRPSAPRPRISMRTRRLISDADHMAQAFSHSDLIRILSTQGDPPDLYRVEYRIHSLEPTKNPEVPRPRDVHEVEIQLTADYPRSAPMCKILTPIFHPNFDPSHICVGDHWAAGERLVDLVVRIGEMLAFQAYNIKSPLDAHAAMWADLNIDKLPTDPRTIRPAVLE